MGKLSIEDLPHYTYDEYIKWEGDWELIRGIAYAMSPAPSIRHQVISQNIAGLLKNALTSCSQCKALLPVDWKVDDETVLQPDNLVVCYEPSGNYLTKAPVLIFEVLSKSTAKKDQTLKFSIYEQEGVKYYIIVNPDDNMAKVYSLNNGRYVKMADAVDEQVGFNLDDCEIKLNFSELWED